MTRVQTVTTSAAWGDSLRDGERIAENLRAQGFTVVVGAEYSNVTAKHYGLISVDLVIEEPETTTAAPAETVAISVEPEAEVVNEIPNPLDDPPFTTPPKRRKAKR